MIDRKKIGSAREQLGAKQRGRVAAIKAAQELIALRARVRELEVERDVWAERAESEGRAKLEERQKLADANALLTRWLVHHERTHLDRPNFPLPRDTRAHLAAQPAAPVRHPDTVRMAAAAILLEDAKAHVPSVKWDRTCGALLADFYGDQPAVRRG